VGAPIAVIPQLTLPTARADIDVRELDAPTLVRRVSVAMPPGRYRAPAAEAMVKALTEVSAQLVKETGSGGRVPSDSRGTPL
jgi:DNA-binding transcriptional LysR family regulator